MKFDANLNTLVNTVMSNPSSAAMIFAPEGTGKTDFLSELGSRYSKVFWFDARCNDMRLMPFLLIDSVLSEDEEYKTKLVQLMFCLSQCNRTEFVIRAVLDYVARVKGKFLFVFEHMEGECGRDSLRQIEGMIRRCPSNLKIVVSSDRFLDFRYQDFEPHYPKVLDETQLQIPAYPTPKNYLAELSREDVGFLIYLSALPSVEIGFVRELYANGERVLRYLSRKRSYVFTREQYTYRFHDALRTYLQRIEREYQDTLLSWNEMGAVERYGDYMFRNKRYIPAFLYYQRAGSVTKCDRALNALMMQNDARPVYALPDFIRFQAVQMGECQPLKGWENHPYYRIFVGLRQFALGESELAATTLAETMEGFRGKDNRTFFRCAGYYCTILNEIGRRQEAIDLVGRIRGDFEHSYPEHVETLLSMFVWIARELNYPLGDLEKQINAENSKQIWYLRAMEDLAMAHLHAGNYRKAVTLGQQLKGYLPAYNLPYELLRYAYYSGDVEEAERQIRAALDFAGEHAITHNLGMLYMALADIEIYYGRIRSGLQNADKAIEADVAEGEAKDKGEWMQHVAHRCILYARYQDCAYALEIATIFLKYCENFAPQALDGMFLALAYCYHVQGDKDKAYLYATRSMTSSKQRTPVWLAATAIVASYRMSRRDLKDAHTLVRNILKHAELSGMNMVVVDYYDGIFDELMDYARRENIEPEFVAEVEDVLYQKLHNLPKRTDLSVKFFGDVSIRAAGVEIQWKTRKSKDLFLHYLLAESAGIDRNAIIDILWKDYLYESAINNLKTTNNLIRKTLAAHGVEFRLDYANSKYSLAVQGLSSDLNEYRRLMTEYTRTPDSMLLCDKMDRLLDVYQDEFAQDIHYVVFEDERKSIRQEMVIALLRLVRFLARQKEFMLAKKYLTALMRVDKQGGYEMMASEIDAHIKVTD